MADILHLVQLKILLIEDSDSDSELIRAMLDGFDGKQCIVTHVGDLESAFEAMDDATFDVALLDINLPDTEGLDGLQRLGAMMPNMPIVIMTGRNDMELATEAMHQGAQDYLPKDECVPAALHRAVCYAIERKQHEAGLLKQANSDALTGLANRLLFESRLGMAIARGRRTGAGFGVLFLDLNDFKCVNDQFGHACGDQLLKDIAERMKQTMRPYDTLARFGGDEFAVLVEGLATPRDAAAVAQKIIAAITPPYEIGERQVKIGVSIGITTSLVTGDVTAEELIEQADEAMYRAKSSVQSNYQFYTPDMHDALRTRLQLENDLRDTLIRNQLSLCYQPRQSLKHGECMGMEALLRWEHPTRGVLLPAEFLAVAEETSMMPEIGEWVIGQVTEDMARWREHGFGELQVSVNISASQLDSYGFAEHITFHLEKNHLPPSHLILEIPESIFLSLNERRENTLKKLHTLGVKLCLDRFGAHLSSLQVLQSAFLSILKLDKSLTCKAEGSEQEIRMVQSIIACARELGLQIIAAGVESDRARSWLKSQQCDDIQGFIFSRPMPTAFLEDWLAGQSLPVPVISRKVSGEG